MRSAVGCPAFSLIPSVIPALILAGCWSGSKPDVTAPTPELPKSTLPHVAAGEFGTFDAAEQFTKSPVITLRSGVGYGWRIRVPCDGMVDVREILKMPSPGDWHVDTRSKISADRTTVTTKDSLACFNGWVSHRWFASPGDPDGVYTVTVEVEGFTPVRFHPRFTRP